MDVSVLLAESPILRRRTGSALKVGGKGAVAAHTGAQPLGLWAARALERGLRDTAYASSSTSAPPAPAPPASEQGRERKSGARRGRILLIDDEPVILSLLARALGAAHDCIATTKASDALERVRAGERFDLILCDLTMPGMDGRELYGELLRVAPEQAKKVIFLTGGAFTPALSTFLASVPNTSIGKPFDIGQLKKTVNALLA